MAIQDTLSQFSISNLKKKAGEIIKTAVQPIQKGLQQTELARIAYQRQPNNLVSQFRQAAPQVTSFVRENYATPLKQAASAFTGFNPLVQATRPTLARQTVQNVDPIKSGFASLGAMFPAQTALFQGAIPAAKGVLRDVIARKPFQPIVSAAQGIKDQPYLSDVAGVKNPMLKKAFDLGETALQFTKYDPESALVGGAKKVLAKGFNNKNLAFKPKYLMNENHLGLFDEIRDVFNVKMKGQYLPVPERKMAWSMLSEITDTPVEQLLNGKYGDWSDKKLLNELERHAKVAQDFFDKNQGYRTPGVILGFSEQKPTVAKNATTQAEKLAYKVQQEFGPNSPMVKTLKKATKVGETPQSGMQTGSISPSPMVSGSGSLRAKPQPELPGGQSERRLLLNNQQASEDIITEAKKQIGKIEEKPVKIGLKQNVKQTLDTLYTQWVDRFHPIVKASQAAKKVGTIAPKNDPEYLVRRLTGAGGIAEATFRRELNPVLKQMEKLNIAKDDMDVYLKARRDIGLAQRGIKGSDAEKADQVRQALEQKYGANIQGIADQLYSYQNKYFDELVQAGFISPESAKAIREQNPDYVPFERVMGEEIENYLGVPTRKTMQGTQIVQKIKGSEKQIYSPIESIIANTFKHRAAIEKNRVAQSIIGLQKIAPDLGFKQVKEAGEDTITVWNNGEKQFWQVGKDIADTAKGVNEESMNAVLKLIQAPASLLRQGATGRNPEFMFPNMIKDQLDAAVASKYGYIPFIDYLSGLKSMVTNDEVFRQFEMSGAKIDLGEMSGRKSIQAMFDQAKSKKKLSQWLGAGLDVMGKFSEQPTRVGLFKKAYKKTGDPLIAMMESRDSTVDFARMGSKMKVANSIIPFLNVGVQGFDKIIRSVKNNPGKVLFNMALYGATPTIATAIYNLQNHPDEYSEIPQYEKDSNFVLVLGRNDDGTVSYAKFPKGNILPLVSNPIESAISYAYKNNQQTFGELATSFISSALPVVGDGSSLKEVGIKTIGSNLPQAIKPLTENLLNKSFYKYDTKKEENKEIVPYYLKDKPAYERSFEFTPVMYKKIGAVMNVSPLQVQNAMEGYLAGYSKIPAQIVEMLNKTSKGEEILPNEKTVLRRFFGRTYPTSNKDPKEEQQAPGLMERVTGKAQAAETTPIVTPNQLDDKQKLAEKNILRYKTDSERISKVREAIKEDKLPNYYEYNNTIYYKDSDGTASIDLSKVTTLPSRNRYEQAIKEQEAYSTATKLIDANLPKEKLTQTLQKIGVTERDAYYYQIAKDTGNNKTLYVLDQLEKLEAKDRPKMLQMLANGRREVNGKLVVSDDVLANLKADGLIDDAEYKELKDFRIIGSEKNFKLKVSGRGKGARLKKIKPVKTTVKGYKPKTITPVKVKFKKISI